MTLPNWNTTSVRFEGPAEKVTKLYNQMKCLEEMKEPLVKNDSKPIGQEVKSKEQLIELCDENEDIGFHMFNVVL